MLHVIDEEANLRIEIAEAKYLVHFREHFPSYEVLPMELDEKAAIEFEKIVDDCIAKNEPYPKPDDYDERLY